MRKVDLADIPSALQRAVSLDAYAEEGQFKPEPTAPSIVEVARVVPPFDLELGMLEMVSRKLELVAGQRQLEGVRTQRCRQERGDDPPNLHSSCNTPTGSKAAAIRAG